MKPGWSRGWVLITISFIRRSWIRQCGATLEGGDWAISVGPALGLAAQSTRPGFFRSEMGRLLTSNTTHKLRSPTFGYKSGKVHTRPNEALSLSPSAFRVVAKVLYTATISCREQLKGTTTPADSGGFSFHKESWFILSFLQPSR